jgi:hypothetical protein
VGGKARSGEHTSALGGFTWPIGRTVYDANAIVGDHSRSLHFLPSIEIAESLSSYGSHRLVVLPAPQLWEAPLPSRRQPPRCYHSSGATTLFCVDCFGLRPQDLENPDFWHDLTKPRLRSALPPATNDDIVLAIPRSAVWHRQEVVSPK